MKIALFAVLALTVLSALISPLSAAHAQGTAFTYQGQLQDHGSPASGTYNLTFSLFNTNSAGTALGGPVTNNAVPVSSGLFTVRVDFGSGMFTGGTNWLQIGVATNGSNAFTALTPRQQLTPTPYAIFATTASNLSGAISLAQLPANIVTNDGGVIKGNGSGLTNIPASAVTGLTTPIGMALIPAGAFTMGDSQDGESDAIPTTNITVSAFYMDVNLTSFSQWQSVYLWATNNGYGFDDPGSGRAANEPVHTVNWFDCVKWCNARSRQAGRPPVYYTDVAMTLVYTNGDSTNVYPNWAAIGYRLPTEAEWEKAARGGLSRQRFPWGNVISFYQANYQGYPAKYFYDVGPNGFNPAFTNGPTPYTSPIGYFAPNGYGLYDMAGNVFAWCWDWYGTPYGQPTNTNPTGPGPGSGLRVLRGGSWIYDGADYCRSACRQNDDAADAYYLIGFRSVLPAGP